METDSITKPLAAPRLTAVLWRMHLLTGILGLIVICLVAFGFNRGMEIIVRRAPRVDAVMEVELEATTSRLRLEKAIRDNRLDETDVIWPHLDRADWYARAMLEGGSDAHGTFMALENVEIRDEVKRLQEKLAALRMASQQRLAVGETSRAGREAGRRYDAAFADVIKRANGIEARMKAVIADYLHDFYWIQLALLALCLLLWITAGLAFHWFERRRTAAIREVSIANDLLAAEITDRERAEKSLELEHDRLIHILGALPDGVYIVSAEYDIEYINPAIEREFGPVDGRKCYQYLNDRTTVCPWCKISKVFAGESTHWEWHSAKNDKLYDLFATSFKNLDGSVSMFQVFHDVTERKRAEEQLHRERNFCMQIVDSLPGLFYVFDEERFVQWNASWEEVTGYSSEELGKLYGPDFFEGADMAMFAERMQEVFREGVSEAEASLVTKDGRRIPYFFTGVRRFFDGVPHLVGLGIDITERKRAEEQLHRERDFSVQIVNSLPGLFYVFDEKRFVQWNDSWEEVTGYSSEELGKLYGPDFFEGADMAMFAERMQEVFREGVSEAEASLVTKDGRRIPYFFTGARRFFDGVPHLVGLGIDITERKAAEVEREKLIARLAAQNAELERFAYTVSHDLKSPLITIKGFVGMLREDIAKDDTEVVENDILRISNAADKMARLLSDLLELSRIGRLADQSQSIPLEELAKEALELTGGQIEENGVRVEIAPDLPMVFGDRTRLLEVLQNLIDNAVKYMGDQAQPRVEIGSRRDGDENVFYVRDNGVGIDHNYLDKVFGLFEQLDHRAEGSGIGLALVKRIIEVHGGRIWVESEGRGRGSTFCFTLPEEVETQLSKQAP